MKPDWRRPYGPLVVAAVAVSTILAPVATSSGEELEHRVGDPGEHAEIGEQLIWFVLPLLALTLALVWVDRRAARTAALADGTGRSTTTSCASTASKLPTVLAVLAVVAALACTVQVYRVGDSGAKAAWGDVGSPAATERSGAVLTVGACEDDPAIRRVLTRALGMAGHEVLTAHNGAEALRPSARTAPSTSS